MAIVHSEWYCGTNENSQDCVWVNIGSGNGLLPDGTKPLPEPMLTSHSWGSMAFTWEQFQSEHPIYNSV